MGEMMLNGRKPLDWERAAMARGYAHVLERDTEVLAGLMPEVPVPRHEGRPVADLVLEFSGPVRRRTGTS
jgi:hypothetical protein